MKSLLPLATPLFLTPLFLALAPAAALQAQLPKIFVASFGNDANDGSRNAPKRNFQAAHNAVATGGQIVALDTAGYGALSISKSVSVTVPPGVNGFVTVSGNANGVSINAGSAPIIALRGLVIEGGGISGTSTGIRVDSVGTLRIEDCMVRNFEEGIFVSPTTGSQISIYNTTVSNCVFGLDIENSTTDTVTVTATGCRVEACTNYGALAYLDTAGGGVDFTLDNCTVRGNFRGVSAQGTNTVLRASNCTIIGNGTGVFADGNGKVLSRGNNTLERNTSGNTFPANSSFSAK